MLFKNLVRICKRRGPGGERPKSGKLYPAPCQRRAGPSLAVLEEVVTVGVQLTMRSAALDGAARGQSCEFLAVVAWDDAELASAAARLMNAAQRLLGSSRAKQLVLVPILATALGAVDRRGQAAGPEEEEEEDKPVRSGKGTVSGALERVLRTVANTESSLHRVLGVVAVGRAASLVRLHSPLSAAVRARARATSLAGLEDSLHSGGAEAVARGWAQLAQSRTCFSSHSAAAELPCLALAANCEWAGAPLDVALAMASFDELALALLAAETSPCPSAPAMPSSASAARMARDISFARGVGHILARVDTCHTARSRVYL